MTERRRPEALLFDLGRVLVGYDWNDSLRRLADRLEGVTVDEILDWILDPHGPVDAYDRGEIDDAAFLEALHARFDPDRRFDDAWLAELWCDMFEPWPAALDLVDRVRPQAALALVSNTNPLHFGTLDHRLGLRERFDHVSVSHEVGALKPEPAIFRHALDGLGVDPDRAWFTDDLDQNLAGARALGIRTHRFETVDELRRELASLDFVV